MTRHQKLLYVCARNYWEHWEHTYLLNHLELGTETGNNWEHWEQTLVTVVTLGCSSHKRVLVCLYVHTCAHVLDCIGLPGDSKVL